VAGGTLGTCPRSQFTFSPDFFSLSCGCRASKQRGLYCRNSSGSLAMFAAMRRASSRVSSFATARNRHSRPPATYASAVVRAVLVRSLSDRGKSCYGFSGLVRGYRLTAAGSMATPEYHRKQVELLLVWAMATAEHDLKAKLLSRALEFWALIDDADDRLLRVFQEVLAEFNAQPLRKP
jgi:hypothetical protein